MRKIPTVIAVVVLVIGVVFGVLLVQQQQVFRLGASPDIAPQDVRITNVTDSSFTVSWITDKATVGFVDWGPSESLGRTARGETLTPKNTHLVTIRNLNPNATYFFKISSDGKVFDNSQISWQVITGPRLTQATFSEAMSGRIVNSAGQPASGVLVYVTSGIFGPLSTITTPGGNWVIPLSEARSVNLSAYANISENTLLEVFVQGGVSGVATAQLFPNAINPVSDITLGKSHDFRSQQTSGPGGVPSASVKLPGDTSSSSGLNIGSEDDSPGESVTLESVADEEIIFTNEPEFFGDGPPGTQITITVESDPITDNVIVSPSGSWSWSPPASLEDGEHTVTISWRDIAGILRTITRTFIVNAADDEPSFESTPSAGITSPTPSPTPSPSPSPLLTPSPSASPSSTPRVSIPSTDSGIPVAGSLTPTILLVTMGVVLLLAGIKVSSREV